MSNKSKVYGYYGGVRTENFYAPVSSVPFIPQPPQVHFGSTVQHTTLPGNQGNPTSINTPNNLIPPGTANS